MSRWLDVEVSTYDETLNNLPSTVELLDLLNDEDYKLVSGDLGKDENHGSKLKVFKGATQSSEITLPSTPTAVVGFYGHDMKPPTLPFIAVAMGTAVYIYKNVKLFFKFHLPSMVLNEKEIEVWNQLSNFEITPETVTNAVQTLKSETFSALSWKSQDLLLLKSHQQFEFIKNNMEKRLHKTSEVSCMTALKMRIKDKFGASCLVLGTEDGRVLFIDPQTFNVMNHATVCSHKVTPIQIIATGLYAVDYRITLATSEKQVCQLRRESAVGKLLFMTDSHIVHMEVMPTDGSTIVICVDQTISSYGRKGKKQWTLNLEHYPITACLIPLHHLGAVLYGVALKSGHVHIYNGKTLVDTIFVKDIVSVMKFGQLGQAEHVLILITMDGNLQIKILKRTAEFNLQTAQGDVSTPSTLNSQTNKPVVIPKKSKLFIEQALREKENAQDMHISFQRDLNMLRLTMAKILIEAHTKSENAIAVGEMDHIRLSAEVEGLGPIFRVALVIENISNTKATSGLALLFHTDPAYYKVSKPYIKIPHLVPNSKLKFPSKVEELFEVENEVNPDIFFRNITGQSSEKSIVKVLLLKEGKSTPILAASIQIPSTDPMKLPIDKIQTALNFV